MRILTNDAVMLGLNGVMNGWAYLPHHVQSVEKPSKVLCVAPSFSQRF